MKLFVGLGNAGAEHVRQRHNVGFMAVERIAEHFSLGPWQRRFSQSQTIEATLGGERFLLLKPTSNINESGRAVGEAQRAFNISINDIYVFHDDIDLVAGKLKIKNGGSNAGHKGLRSVTAHIGNEYTRIRIGVGRASERKNVRHFVLQDFAKVDYKWLDPLLDAIANSTLYLRHEDNGVFLDHVACDLRKQEAVGEIKTPHNPLRAKEQITKSLSFLPQLFRGEKSLLESAQKRYRSVRKAGRAVLRACWYELLRNYGSLKRSKSKATYIAVTGSSAKTSTVALLSHILSAEKNVLTQLHGNGALPTWKTLADVRREHDYVILEIGTYAPGDIRRMAKIVRPDVAIVTLVGLEHYSAFRSKEAVAKEKGSLVDALRPSGIAVLNNDDPYVIAMSASSKARVVTFGKSKADYLWDKLISTQPGGLSFLLNYRDRQLRLETRFSGKHNCLAVSAAAACALELGVSEATVIERIASFEPVFCRMSTIEVKQGPIFILDSFKSPYESIPLVLESLRDFAATKKRFVLGHISDYKCSSGRAYRNTYRAALDVADQVIFVGDTSHRSGATKAEVEQGKFIAFRTVKEASDYIRSTSVPGEVVLLKGSRNLHLERIALDWEMPINCWEDYCGCPSDCKRCGLYGERFSEHRGKPISPLRHVPCQDLSDRLV